MNRFLLLLLPFLLFSCVGENDYVIRGKYASAPDGTVLYISSYRVFDVDDIIAPLDSAVVKNGKFEFSGECDGMDVCFICSSHVIDGGFVVVESGCVDFDMSGKVTRGGTVGNEKLERFLNEKDRLIAMQAMTMPYILEAIAPTDEVRDSIMLMADLGARVFSLYAAKEVEENIGNALGHFILTQSAGIALPEVMYGLFQKMPESLHDRLYSVKKMAVEESLDEDRMVALYEKASEEAAMFTSVGRKFVNFELNDITGGKVLVSDVVSLHKYTVLLFWGSWDAASKSSLDELVALCSRFVGKSLALVTVSMDSSLEECRAALPVVEKGMFHLCNPGGGCAEVASAYGITDLPCMYVINEYGTIIVRTSAVKDVESKLNAVF